MFEIIQLSWRKRRRHNRGDEKPQISHIRVEGFSQKPHSICSVTAKVDGVDVDLTGQVGYNQIKDYWYINAINSSGLQIAFKIS